ncbi:biotin carboxylase N-terminal domain-containing protein [Roseomonas sp. E05]|uniref:acetyl-CoA carboxylase biotin carboxylase subunit n=1 Tax=Roseomonas sp. E05 TaxID=3046310 RepID=UPI0024BB4499|nr:biotin carboxylase N-terminal domain-containing protein [Roseomonas sp. E05]MDJ0390802.1 biotin carboxylase N-terminal domain-containing protein [Roseomonas sp. E05]
MRGPVLIANRGEIACRIAATCRRMGLPSIAVFSEADAEALHVAAADRAEPIGPAHPSQSYLSVPALLEAARRSGARMVHPGYGFLSENAEFAEACADAGLTFIGPPPAAIRAMGSKAAAKAVARRAGVAAVPGYDGEDQSDTRLLAAAQEIGFPMLIKAVAGGGGRGMRSVASAEEFPASLAAARREAMSFGDSRVLVEKLIPRARHIEVQILADTGGKVLHLGERDCTLQRRHQKLVEESPAPGLDAALRAELGRRAIALAEAVGYVGAGTVEFVAEAGDAPTAERIWFIEMNTRLQVEHPVTEMVTGLDLVEWQIRVAGGEALPWAQDAVRLEGHAVEARLCAEDPARNFLPSPGRLQALALPEARPGLRIDTGVREGDTLTPFYDPMIAKVIAHAPTRAEALTKLAAALDRCSASGVRLNAGFLAAALRSPEMAAGQVDTHFLDRARAGLLAATAA